MEGLVKIGIHVGLVLAVVLSGIVGSVMVGGGDKPSTANSDG